MNTRVGARPGFLEGLTFELGLEGARASEDPEEGRADGGHGGARPGNRKSGSAGVEGPSASSRMRDAGGKRNTIETACVREPGSEAEGLRWGAVPGPREAGLTPHCCLPVPSSAYGEMVDTV